MVEAVTVTLAGAAFPTPVMAEAVTVTLAGPAFPTPVIAREVTVTFAVCAFATLGTANIGAKDATRPRARSAAERAS
jgi:energy-converting hydrogenase Eha subunit A